MTTSDTPTYFIGAWGDNVIKGSGANEVFFAPGGDETLTGGGSRDVYIVDSEVKNLEITNFNPNQDILAVFTSTGVGTLAALAADAHVTSAGIEIDLPDGGKVVLDGVTSVSALTSSDVIFPQGAFTPPTTNTSLSTLLGGVSPDFVVTSWGSHTVTGTGSTEVFFNPGGNEVLTGGGSRDIYVVDSTTQKLEITNFNPNGDVLYIGSSAGVTSLQTLSPYAHLTTGGLEIDLPKGAVILLDGITSLSALSASDTAFFAGAFTPPSTTVVTPPAPAVNPLSITATAATLASGQSVGLASLVSASDSAGSIADYYVYDPSHSIQLNGAANLANSAAQDKGYVEVSAADFAKLTFVGGSAGDVTLMIAVTDGAGHDANTKEVITVTGGSASTAPTAPEPAILTPLPQTIQSGQSVAVTSLFSVSAPSANPVSDYFIYDPSHGIQLNGATNLDAAEQANGAYEVSAADIGKLTYLAGNAGSVHMQFLAYDGTYGAWVTETVTVQSSVSLVGLFPSGVPHITVDER